MDGVDYEAGGSLWTAAFCIANFNTEVRHKRHKTEDSGC